MMSHPLQSPPETEPWLRGPIEGLDPILAAPLFTFQQAREELARHTEGFTSDQLWSKPHGSTPLGFHIRHMGGSIERLATYLGGGQLSESQLAAMKREPDPGATREELLEELEKQFQNAEQAIRAVDLKTLSEPRYVGRKRFPTTVVGLVIHIAEHTQRHLGQAVTTAKLLRAG